MTLADSGYPLGNALLTMAVFFCWVLWIWLLIAVYSDLFRRDDISGWGKAGWVILTLVLPFLGVFIYLISQAKAMGERQLDRALQQQRALDERIYRVAGSARTGPAAQREELAKANQLRDQGAVTQQEYEVLRSRAMNTNGR